jgi:hypothetical protein
MSTRLCAGVKADGTQCRRPPSRDSDYCLSHDPARVAEHAEASRAGGIARHDPEVSAAKAEIRDVKAALWSGKLTPGAGSVLLQAIRLEREVDAEDSRDASGDALVVSIQRLRDDPEVIDLSEPAANDPHGGNTGVVDMSEDSAEDDPDAPRFEDYQGRAHEYIRDKAAHDAVPLSHLSTAERRKRWQRNQQTGA